MSDNYNIDDALEEDADYGARIQPPPPVNMPQGGNIYIQQPANQYMIPQEQPKKQTAVIVFVSLLIGIFVLLSGLIAYRIFAQIRDTGSFSFSYRYGTGTPGGFDFGTDNTSDDSDTDSGIDDDYGFGSTGSASGSPSVTPLDEDEIDDILSGNQNENTTGDYEYYSFDNYIVDNLSYQVEIEKFEYTDDNSQIYIECPVVTGPGINIDMAAKAAREEADYWVDYINTAYINSGDDSQMILYIKSYITYMSEDVLSIAYSEQINYAGSSAFQIVSTNIDIPSGMKLDNTSMMSFDLEFAEDMIQRSSIQNSAGSLDNYSPETLLEALNNEAQLIIFYTPIGLEVGINVPTGWVTVTYPDYEKYINTF